MLTKDPRHRLGSGAHGADDVLNHPFFDEIDPKMLLNKEITPPFNPGVNEVDTMYAPTIKETKIIFSDRVMSYGNGPSTNAFDGFSFGGRAPTTDGNESKTHP